MDHQTAEHEASRLPASAATTPDPLQLRPPLAAPPSFPAGGVDGTMEAGLPDDPLVEILSRLPDKPLYRFKCVSKHWCDLIASRLGCTKFPQTTQQGFFYGDDETHRHQNYGHFIDPFGKSLPLSLVDPCFTFLTKLPGIEKIVLLRSCNGLVLFGHRRVSDMYDTRGYIVCNPATEQWTAVPSSGWSPWSDRKDDYITQRDVLTYLIFDPSVSPHFHLVQLWQKSYRDLDGVRTYSSETGVWKPNGGKDWRQWGLDAMVGNAAGCPLNGMLYLKADDMYGRGTTIVAVDSEGKTSKILPWAENHGSPDFLGQSHGLLYCITTNMDGSYLVTELSIWALEDYFTQDWRLKHTVSIFHLFGKTSCIFDTYEFIAIHPDRNLLFFLQYWDWKLISYNMDSKEVCDICTLGRYESITPYVPYFSGLSVLENKH